ncbi:hypothetical protein ACFLU5_11235 [Bacteroidota bacterium]
MGPNKLILILIIIFLGSGINPSFAQTTSTKDFPTKATDLKAEKVSRKKESETKRYRYIIKKNSMNTLYGNQCYLEVTRKFGFEYAIECSGLGSNPSGIARWSHNFGVKFVLFFRNGPLWQHRMKKKYKHCMYQYGDFRG